MVHIACRRNVKKVRSELRNCEKQAARNGPERRSSEKLQGPYARSALQSEVAVVVDTFAEVRESDVMNLAQEPQSSMQHWA